MNEPQDAIDFHLELSIEQAAVLAIRRIAELSLDAFHRLNESEAKVHETVLQQYDQWLFLSYGQRRNVGPLDLNLRPNWLPITPAVRF